MSDAAALSVSVFPADWNVIAMAGQPFTHDPMHFPFPVSPLMASTQFAFETGYGTALREAGIPLRDIKVRHVNHYRFERMVFDAPASEAEAAAMEAGTQRELARMLDRWYGEHRPRLLVLLDRLRELHPLEATSAEVVAMLDEVDAIHIELWTIHFRIAVAGCMLLSMQLLRELHDGLFGDDGDGALILMAGTPSESMKAAFGLADLTQRARNLGLADSILATPLHELMSVLQASEAGQHFLAALDIWLEDYGLRQDLFDFATPTWREDPTVALANVRSFLETGHDPRVEHERVARAAEAAFEEALAKLAAYPGAVREQFEQFVQFGRQGAFLQEEHNYYIDQTGISLLRLFYLEVGGWLRGSGVLDAPEDIFMLRVDEVRELVAEPAPERARVLVATRREEMARAAGMTPPPMIGDPATFPPLPDTAVTRTMLAFFGGPPRQAATPGQLQGTPGSRGIASGPARVARTLDEAKAVRPGEILVTVTTMPAWTPLFGVAAAVVTETGGPLSHCAIVAREYGIPAVVGAHGATRAIQTGQRVTVDGVAGVVTIDS